MRKGRLTIRLWVSLAMAVLLLALGCSAGDQASDQVANSAASAPAATVNSAPEPASASKPFPVLGADVNGEEVPIENGQRVPLRDGVFAEVFVVPYPPTPETDLHLFLFQGQKPLKGAQIVAVYDMIDMDHGAKDRQIGREVEDGHYVIPLDLFMWGDWVADAAISHPEFDTSLRLLLGVYLWKRRSS